jgi:hypothetical protein
MECQIGRDFNSSWLTLPFDLTKGKPELKKTRELAEVTTRKL